MTPDGSNSDNQDITTPRTQDFEFIETFQREKAEIDEKDLRVKTEVQVNAKEPANVLEVVKERESKAHDLSSSDSKWQEECAMLEDYFTQATHELQSVADRYLSRIGELESSNMEQAVKIKGLEAASEKQATIIRELQQENARIHQAFDVEGEIHGQRIINMVISKHRTNQLEVEDCVEILKYCFKAPCCKLKGSKDDQEIYLPWESFFPPVENPLWCFLLKHKLCAFLAILLIIAYTPTSHNQAVQRRSSWFS